MRLLNANEIEVRVGMCKEKGASLLLYKNARVDMQLMDETYGPLNWKREHNIINGNNYCKVSVYNEKTQEWINKEDCGTESMTEKEKGEASDSFKRACVNWGIGRELYTAGFIWITNIQTYESKGKWKTNDKFTVKKISYNDEREINDLIIVNQRGQEVFNKKGKTITKKVVEEVKELDPAKVKVLYTIATKQGYSRDLVHKTIKKKYQINSTKNLTVAQFKEMCDGMEKNPVKKEGDK